MSYSIQIRARSKEEAGTAILAAIEQQVVPQDLHSRDLNAIRTVACGAVAALDEPAGSHDVVVELSGHLAGRYDDAFRCNFATINVKAYLAPRTQALPG